MRIIVILTTLMLLSSCGSDKGIPGSSDVPKVTYHEDLAIHPDSVRAVAKFIENISSGSSLDEYQKALGKTKLVEVPHQHFKDYEYYWEIHSVNEEASKYIIIGAFRDLTEKLAYSSINMIEEESGNWKTIWSIQHDLQSNIKPRLNGVGPE